MIHPIQFLNAYASKGAAEYGCSIAEYRECMDEHTALVEWMRDASRWLRIGPMGARWWNAVRNNGTAIVLVDRWLKENPDQAQRHGMDRAMCEVRRAA